MGVSDSEEGRLQPSGHRRSRDVTHLGGTAMYRPRALSASFVIDVRSSRRTRRLAGSTVMESVALCLSLTGSEPVGRGVYRGRGGDR